jgi:hypothetical protein
MMNHRIAGFILAGLVVSTPASALSESQVNGVRPGMPYAEARARLLEFGYEGAASPPARCPAGREALCRRNPRELEDCAGTGRAPCLFVFRYPRGRTIEVVTEGDRPVVRAIRERSSGAR